MKKKKFNQIDYIVENLASSFSKIENFELLQESEEGRKLFDFIVKSIADMESFQSLFLNYYIPASNKSIADSWSQISSSKYKHLLNISKSDLKDNLYETIRLGYVGLFHKYESYLKALVDAVNFLLKELNEISDLLSIEKYCQREYGINIYKSHNHFAITCKVNYISNCIKHYDGLPVKEPIHERFAHFSKDEKIQIERDEFKSDIDRMKGHCELLLSQILAIGFKQFIESEIHGENENARVLKEKYDQILKNFEYTLSDFSNPRNYFTQ
ncbi:hypothetical protein [Gilvibacter sp. SZ-19]|uniref:hypothetical protein n=1 Tax=Gilvibacter sp. SZ-19 TaxID=754429 RepID=UPI000B3CDB99|nr:hypothetical protein [Gilvibacter sp. SZ-19]